jgi:hypothetical protein
MVALLVASILPDLADFVLPQGNLCRVSCGIYTHAFPAFVVLAIAASALAWAIWHRKATSLLVGALVGMHVLFDLPTGFKPFWYGGPSLGLGLYRYQLFDFLVESGMVVAGWIILRRSPNPPRWAVHYLTLITLVALQATFDIVFHMMYGG